MRTRSKQTAAGVLALSAAYGGVWAAFVPRSFYRSFPFVGHHWVAVLGPYNEHLVRDVGELYLALFVVSAWVALRPRTESLRVVGVAWLAAGVPHLTFHLFHLDMYGTADKVGNIVVLVGTVLLAALLLAPTSASMSAGTENGRGEVRS